MHIAERFLHAIVNRHQPITSVVHPCFHKFGKIPSLHLYWHLIYYHENNRILCVQYTRGTSATLHTRNKSQSVAA